MTYTPRHGPSAPYWPGYAPWTETVLRCRDEFFRTARQFWLLPEILEPIVRDDVALLYCFCRRLDDAVDEAPSREAARDALRAFADELQEQASPRPLVAALLAARIRVPFPVHAAEALITGMASDLEPVRIPDDAALIQYCYRVSASVGLMLCAVLKIEAERSIPRAVDLGLALQLTNILLGVGEDARRDRVYLPATRLAAEGLTPGMVLDGSADRAALRRVMAGIADLADRYYNSADEGTRDIPWRYRHGVLVLSRFYGAMGRRTMRSRHDPFTDRVRLPWWEKAGRMLEVWLVSWEARMIGWDEPPPHDAALHEAIAGWPGTAGSAHRGAP
jgi:15-cis-phytoene synthase